ncbi:MAG TPA: heparinase II/III family protein [Clostridia bacterium]|nr:heparinase II/III family protein [Clostridia bacterium]
MLVQLLEKAGGSLPATYQPFPPLSDRSHWDKVSSELSTKYIKAAEEYLTFDFPVLKATDFMEYHRTGNRTGYQNLYGHRRHALNIAMLAELFENKGRFIDLMIDMVWLLCEQTTWIIPAHNKVAGYQHQCRPLPDYDRPIVALMSADVAASLALAYYFFKDSFDMVSPQISERIKSELHRRILKPYRDHTDYWWMGFLHEAKEQLNNWNPWINSNVLMVLLLIEDNREERLYQLRKLTESLDRYIDSYPEDGGCDEGPGYWGRAGASCFECLDLLYDFSGGSIDIYGESKIVNMSKYIYRAHIVGPYFVNFADAGPRATASPSLIYRFARFVKDETGMAFGAHLYKTIDDNTTLGRFGIIRPLHEAGTRDEILSYSGEYAPEKASFLPDIEVAFLRTDSSSGELYTAVKGGNNFENHNHNDIGNFIIYGAGKPFIVDVGAKEYTRKTFSSERYEIWNNNSRWHNVPEVNDLEQINGRDYRASDVSFTNEGNISRFSADIQKAYPVDSGITKWRRSVTMDHEKAEVVVSDDFELEMPSSDIRLNLITCPIPRINGNHIVMANDGTTMEIIFPEDFDAEFETIQLDDTSLKSSWGEVLYRLTIYNKKEMKKGNCSIVCRLIEGV